MQSLNDDMDDLFRKAAENYPLKTNNADWDKVLERLNAPNAPLPEPVAKKNDGYKRLLWLLLLIPLAFGVKLITDSSSKHGTQRLTQSANKTNTGNNHSGGNKGEIVTEEKSNTNNAIAVTAEKNAAAQSGNQSKTSADNNAGKKDANVYTLQKLPEIKRSVENNNNAEGISNDGQQKSTDKGNSKTQPEANNNPDNTNVTNGTNTTSGVNNLPNPVSTVPAAAAASAGSAVQTQQTTPAENIAGNKDTGSKANIEDQQKQVASAKNVKKKETYSLQKGVYLSIIGGPDFSTIKGQNVDVGYSIGLLVGYRFAKKFSAEAGLLWDKKSYYSDGKYFKTNKINLPDYVTILNVDGNCKMIEIPVNVRYDFATRKKGSWYVTAGSSTYLMKKEDYNYDYKRYNTAYTGYKEYSNSANNWFSIINISAGYEKKIGKTSAIRLEPYIKIPASGVGIGSMPITSFGIYAGFTKQFK
ncbi:outer membrane beta-barrel protein [Danxiaibacter flavus]|uniref:Outer membrane beta-barrel protein n=1 Tax=Danxiaibacter flavus TaxID=3049108 RepID=A0ABV3ZJI1_9BACT|nr:outer membrane beta-barrel protein [Chitinophagaceae bacterium DXS]